MEPDAQPDEAIRSSGETVETRGRVETYDTGRAILTLRAIGFVWVTVNVYLIISRFSVLGKVPIGFAMAFAVVILSTWAALESRRWGWLAMMLLAAVSICDFAVASSMLAIRGIREQLAWNLILREWLSEFNWLGLGTAFGMTVVGIWFVSLAALLSRPVRLQVFANKRQHLTPAQAVIAAVLVAIYLMGVVSVGATSRAVRRPTTPGRIRSHTVVPSMGRSRSLDGLPPITLQVAKVAAQRATARPSQIGARAQGIE